MKAWLTQARWALWPAVAALLWFMVLTAHGGWWEKMGVEHMRPFFADTVTTLAGAETWAEGGDPYSNNYRDPYQRPHSYGPWWLWAAKVGLGRRDAWWIGALTVIGFLAAAAATVAPRTAGGAVALALLLMSPPVLLGMERGNSDLPMFMLLALAGWLLGAGAHERSAARVGGAATIVVAAALKFYPLVSLVALWGQPGSTLRRVTWGALGACAFFVVWWLQGEHFVRALREAARPQSLFTMGLPLAKVSWDGLGQYRVWLFVGALPALSVGVFVFVRGWRGFWDALPITGGRAAAAVAGGAAWLLCYASTTNFGYRAVLLLFLARFWWQSFAGRVLTVLLIVCCWLDAPKYQLAQLRGEMGEAERAWFVSLSGFGQMAIFAVSAVVACMLVGWAWRREFGAGKPVKSGGLAR